MHMFEIYYNQGPMYWPVSLRFGGAIDVALSRFDSAPPVDLKDPRLKNFLNEEGQLQSYDDLHDGEGVRPCSTCSKTIRQGWITEGGDGPWCSPVCMGWDNSYTLEEDMELLDYEILYWTEWHEVIE